jgi:hypothetical protein
MVSVNVMGECFPSGFMRTFLPDGSPSAKVLLEVDRA